MVQPENRKDGEGREGREDTPPFNRGRNSGGRACWACGGDGQGQPWRWDEWHRYLKGLSIEQVHIPTLGAKIMVRPTPPKRGKKAYCVYTVKLTGSSRSIATLECFRSDQTLLATWKPSKAVVPHLGAGESSEEDAAAARKRLRNAEIKNGTDAAKMPIFEMKEEE